MDGNKQEGGFFTIGQNRDNSSGSTQQQYLDKFSSATTLQSAENTQQQGPAQAQAVDNALVDQKPGSFLF